MITNAHVGQPSFSTQEELDALLLEAQEGDESVEMTPDEWKRLQEEVEQDIKLLRKAS